MGYRMSIKGRLAASHDTLTQVAGVLDHRKIDYDTEEPDLVISHSDRNMMPGDHRIEKALKELAELLEEPQKVVVWTEFHGEQEILIGDGRVRQEMTSNVWSNEESVPTPEQILTKLRARGLAVRLTKVKGRRGGARQFEFQPSSGGASCRVTVKRRFWDSFDLLAVPEIARVLCDRYGLSAEQLRANLYGSAFGLEVRNPASGGASTDLLFDNLLEVVEEMTHGIRTPIG
jgi:hypothetical protein